MNDKLNFEKKLLKISIAGNIVFMLAEGIIAYMTSSNSLLMDCVFDLADVIMIGPFLVLIPLLYKPVTEKRPYGFSQVESLFVIIKCGILVVITAQLVFSSFRLIIRGGNSVDAGLIAAFELIQSVVCMTVYLILRHYNKKSSSPSIKADLYTWKMDSISSFGVGVAFIGDMVLAGTTFEWAARYIDPVAAIVLALGLIAEPIKMIISSIKNLVLFAPDEEMMEDIRGIVSSHLEHYPYSIEFLDVIQTGRKAWVQIYIGGEKDLMSMAQLKTARDAIKKELKKNYDEIYVELIPDLDD